jgi:hypothetical protein
MADRGTTGAGDQGPFRHALATLDASLDAVEAALADVRPFVARAHAGLGAGQPVADLVVELLAGGANVARSDLGVALRAYERAMQAVRAEAVRGLVDAGRLTMTEAARVMGVSPQMARRLYNVNAAAAVVDVTE